jgi:hypothetical protein
MSRGGKTIAFKVPQSRLAPAADAWITNRGAAPASEREEDNPTELKHAEAALPATGPREKMSRFTIDVPESLHRRVKMQCAGRGQKMADMMRELLEREFPEA